MKKIIILIFLSTLFISAAVSASEVEFNGGITYNTFTGNAILIDNENIETEEDEVPSGRGYYIEGLYPINQKLLIGCGYDYAGSDYNSNIFIELSGPYGKLAYKLSNKFTVNLGIVNYTFKEFFSTPLLGMNELEFAKGTGYLFGVSYKNILAEKISIVLSANYRKAVMDFTDKADEYYDLFYGADYDFQADFSGVNIGAALNISF